MLAVGWSLEGLRPERVVGREIFLIGSQSSEDGIFDHIRGITSRYILRLHRERHGYPRAVLSLSEGSHSEDTCISVLPTGQRGFLDIFPGHRGVHQY